MANLVSIGQPAGHIEGPAKVTGRALYTADVTLPGARPLPGVPVGPSKGKKSPNSPAAPAVAAVPGALPPAPASASSAKTSGVAGGLQIKTNYP